MNNEKLVGISRINDVPLSVLIEVTVKPYRKTILTAVEGKFSHSPEWPALRSTLLSALGERGLEGALFKLFQNSTKEGERVL